MTSIAKYTGALLICNIATHQWYSLQLELPRLYIVLVGDGSPVLICRVSVSSFLYSELMSSYAEEVLQRANFSVSQDLE